MNVGRWQREFDVALTAAREGALLAREIRHQRADASFLKPDESPVTVADFAVQALVIHRLEAAGPHDPVVAEEDAAALRVPGRQRVVESIHAAVRRVVPDLDVGRVLDLIDRGRAEPAERFWTLDPVDGTQGFVRGDQYVVALALVIGGAVEVGVIACPALTRPGRPVDGSGWIACAVRDGGAYAASLHDGTFSPLHVSPCRQSHIARVVRSFEVEHIDLTRFTTIVEILGVQTPPLLMDSQAKHALIAAGGADVLIRVPATKTFRDKIWDQAAGSLVIEEAGGRVTDLNGVALKFDAGRRLTGNEGVIASNGLLHDAVLDAVQRAAIRP